MSSHDFGPSLPPHMKRSQHHSDHVNIKSRSSPNQRKYEDRKDRHLDKHRDRDRDYGRGRDRERGGESTRWRRDRYQHEERYRDKRFRDRYSSKKSDSEFIESNSKQPKEKQVKDSKKNYDRHTASSSHSKRSKSDRTYNTDTEESSDEDGGANQWNKLDKGSMSSEHSSIESADEMQSSVNPDCQFSSENSTVNLSAEISPCSSVMGPALPPHLMTQQNLSASQVEHKIEEKSDLSGIESNKVLDDSVEPIVSACDDSVIGPALPPHLETASSFDSAKEDSLIGPALPPGFKTHQAVTSPGSQHQDETHSSESGDDEIVGPLLPGEVIRSRKNYIVQSRLEKNAAAVKEGMEGQGPGLVDSVQREEWMTILPPEGAVDLGLGPRSFRMKGAPERGADRSAWTDTPADKARKEEEARRKLELGCSTSSADQNKPVSKELSSRDRVMGEIVKSHSKKRTKESLLEAHQKKLKKEKKKKEESGLKQERRPFNRDIDLKTNVFDDAQKKSIFKKAQLLDSRFSTGESKFL